MFNNLPPPHPPKTVPFMSMWENTVEPGRSQMSTEHGACALEAGYLRLRTHRHRIRIIIHSFPPQQWLRERFPVLRYSALHVLFYSPISTTQN